MAVVSSHRVDKKTPIEKTIEAMVELKKYAAAYAHAPRI
jgi:hypothetical protein